MREQVYGQDHLLDTMTEALRYEVDDPDRPTEGVFYVAPEGALEFSDFGEIDLGMVADAEGPYMFLDGGDLDFGMSEPPLPRIRPKSGEPKPQGWHWSLSWSRRWQWGPSYLDLRPLGSDFFEVFVCLGFLVICVGWNGTPDA